MKERTTNRACIYRQFGRPHVLEIVTDWPYPRLDDNGVIIKVAAVSMNPKDTLLRKGKFNKTMAREPLPRGTALDACGEIVEVGKNVQGLHPGDQVYGMTNRFSGGLLCDYAFLKRSEISFAPATLSAEQSAAIPLAGLTALQALRDCCRCRAGSKLLVVGASGGVGHFAVQIGSALGADVDAVCSTANTGFVTSLGAHRVFNYDRINLSDIEQTYDALFDVSGMYERNQFEKQLGNHGVFVSTVPKLTSIWGELLSRLKIRRTSRLVIVRSNTHDLEQLTAWIEQRSVTPAISATFQFCDVQAAHAQMESGHTRGKIVVTT